MRTITHINPPELHTSPAFSQGTIAEAGRTLYVGGQNGTDSQGRITGDTAAQAVRALRNDLPSRRRRPQCRLYGHRRDLGPASHRDYCAPRRRTRQARCAHRNRRDSDTSLTTEAPRAMRNGLRSTSPLPIAAPDRQLGHVRAGRDA